MKRTLSSSIVLVCLAATASPADVDQVDSETDRVPMQTIIPEYPAIARRDRIEGEVQVCFDISRAGFPLRVAVRDSSNRVFEKPARKAVRNSRWVPLKKDEPLPGIKACRTFRFSLVPVEEALDQS